ncbi:MAG: DUF481 domain-containing protein [Woeseiaceae bacterium]|nr:DUF481 domain-containing protein [Woeseiaceae bacterium]
MNRRRYHWGASLALFGAITTADADVLYMQNGDRITGSIKRIWDGELFIESDYADEFAVKMESVERIETDGDVEIKLRDDSELTGRFGQDESGAMVLINETATVPLALTDVEELEEPEVHFEWETRSDLSLGGSRGNTETNDFLWQGYGRVKFGDHRHELDLRFDRKEQDELVTKEQYNSSYFYSWFFSDSWFLGSGIGYERDPIRQLTDRFTAGAGFGYQFFEDADRLLEVTLAAIGVRENIAGFTNDSSTAQWNLTYRRDVTSDMEIYHNHRLTVYLTGRSNQIADTTTGIRWDVWGDIYLNAQLNWNWESDPAVGKQQTDLTYALGIGIELD